MDDFTSTREFLQAVFPAWGPEARFANLEPAVFTRDFTTLDLKRGCYWSIGGFGPDAKTHAAGKDFLHARALVIDDVGTKVPEGAVALALGPPTAIVETSAGNYQWAYRLSRPVAKADWPGVFGGVEALIMPPKPLEGSGAQHLFRLPMGRNIKKGRGNFAVRLVSVDPSREYEVDLVSKMPGVAGTASVAIATGPVAIATGPGPSTQRIHNIRDMVAAIPNNILYDEWIAVGERIKALAIVEEDGREAFHEFSARATLKVYDADYTEKKWHSFTADRTQGGLLVKAAQDIGGAAVEAWWQSEAAPAFPDDGVEPPSSSGGGGVEFSVDQEKASIAVVDYLGGRLKCVGRDDWREFDETTGRWSEWTGNHMLRRVLEMVRDRKGRPMDPEVSKKLGSVKFIENIARAAALHRSVIARVTDFDREALLLGVPSGVIDLRKGASRAVRRGAASEMVSKAMWVDPAPAGTAHPEWSRFLGEFTQGDAALEEWLQVRAGYCLTGLMDEHIMPFYHGPGGNGKSVYLNALRSVWGEYGSQVEHRLLFEKQGGYHLAPLAVLAGVRLAIVTDVPQGASWDVHIMKMLTGDDAITANRMHQNPVTFKSTAKVDVSGNGEPTVRDMDEGVRRRLKLIPLTARPKIVDKALSRKLMGEWGAILSWALAGLDMYWGLGGFPAAKVVDDATDAYHALLDPFQRWVEQAVMKDPSQGAKVSTSDLFRSWDAFRCGEARPGASPASAAALARKMVDKGFIFGATGGKSLLRGYKLAKTDAENVF